MRRLFILLSLLAISCVASAQQPVTVQAQTWTFNVQTTNISGTASVNTAYFSLASGCSVGVTLANTNFTATVGFQESYDGGSSSTSTGQTVYRQTGATTQALATANLTYSGSSATQRFTLFPRGGATHIRVSFTGMGTNAGTNITTVSVAGCDRNMFTAVNDNGAVPGSQAMLIGGNRSDNTVGYVALDASNSVVVTGEGVDGVITPANNVAVGGKDGSGNSETLRTETNGRLQIFKDSNGITSSAPIVCDQSAQGTAAAAANTQMVALVSAKKIYVCNLIIQGTGAAGTAKVVYGTGTACATGTTNLTPAWTTAIGTFLPAFGTQGSFPIMSTASANALCIVMATTSATSNWFVNYAQF